MSLAHPHRRRTPRHARTLIRQMLKFRTAMRAGTLQVHAMQLDSAVNRKDYPDRVHPDSDRFGPGVRVVVGPETRSLLRQLLESRDIRVQQQLVREIIHQIQKRTIAAVKRAKRLEKARELAGRSVQATRRAARRHGGRLGAWFRSLPARAKAGITGRTTRTVGNRKPATRTRTTTAARPRAAAGDGRATRTKQPTERTSRTRAARE